MKKLIALLLMLCMLLACGCGGGKNAEDDIIKPSNDDKVTTLEDANGQVYDVYRITTQNNENAEEVLAIVKEHLSGLGISAKLKALYAIHLGIASEYEEIYLIKAVFTDESVSPLYVVMLKDMRKYTAGFAVISSFRDSDVSGNAYFDKTVSCIEAYNEKLLANLGFNSGAYSIDFPIHMSRDLACALPDTSQEELWKKTMETYNRYTTGMWTGYIDPAQTAEIGGRYYQKLVHPEIKKLDDFDNYLGSAFTKRNIGGIRAVPSGDKIYTEKDGAVYVATIGMGGIENLEETKLKYTAVHNGYLFMIIEMTWVIRDDGGNVLSTSYSENMLVYEKENGEWKCDYFNDYLYGRYTSTFDGEEAVIPGPSPDKPEVPEFDRLDAIKPLKDPEKLTLHDNSQGTEFDLIHIDTDSYPDAKDILDVAYAYLEAQGINGLIKAMYKIPMGFAGQYDSFDPIKIIFTDESIPPLYIVPLVDAREYTKGWAVMGSFRDADVSNSEYFNKVLDIHDLYSNGLLEKLGLREEDISVLFPIVMTRDLNFVEPVKSHMILFENSNEVYFKYALATWYDYTSEESATINGNYYQKLNHPDIKSVADFDTYLQSAFTKLCADEIKLYRDMTGGEYPIYVDHEGAVYVAPMGMGGPEDLEDAYIRAVAQQGDSRLFMIIEAKRCDRDDNWKPINIRYTEHLRVFEKDSEGNWKCDWFDDHVYGFYTSPMR